VTATRGEPAIGASAFVREHLPFFLGPLLGQSAQAEPPTDDDFTLAEDLRQKVRWVPREMPTMADSAPETARCFKC